MSPNPFLLLFTESLVSLSEAPYSSPAQLQAQVVCHSERNAGSPVSLLEACDMILSGRGVNVEAGRIWTKSLILASIQKGELPLPAVAILFLFILHAPTYRMTYLVSKVHCRTCVPIVASLF